jgi:hypothetical protein
MNPKCCATRATENRQVTLDKLMRQIHEINRQKSEVMRIKLPIELEKEVFAELEKRKDEIKESMHNCIDDL